MLAGATRLEGAAAGVGLFVMLLALLLLLRVLAGVSAGGRLEGGDAASELILELGLSGAHSKCGVHLRAVRLSFLQHVLQL